MNDLIKYITENAIRGDCTCGRCVDSAVDPQQPSGHTVDLTFFKVAAQPEAKAEDLLALVRTTAPHWLDGAEHSYLQVGGDLGDQGLALMVIGLGQITGAWKALCPETMAPFLPDEMKRQMAGMGMISLQTERTVA